MIEAPEGETVMTEKFFVETDKLITRIVAGVDRPTTATSGRPLSDADWPVVQAAGIMTPPPLPIPAPTPPTPPTQCSPYPHTRPVCPGTDGKPAPLHRLANKTHCEQVLNCCFNGTSALPLRCFGHGDKPPPAPAPPPQISGAGGALMYGFFEIWSICKRAAAGANHTNHTKHTACDDVITALGPLLDYTKTRFVSADEKATYVNLQLSVDPFSPMGQQWLSYVREQLPTGPDGVAEPRYYMTHGAAEIKDAADTVISSLFMLQSID